MTGPNTSDDTVTVVAISALAAMLGDVLHEGVGHALVALLTGTPSGVLSTVAWSSAHDTRLVAAGGTLVNLIAGVAFWLALRRAGNASARARLFLFCGMFNLLTGTGYFLFSGAANVGDWAMVIAGLHPAWAWRSLLVIVGASGYFLALRVLGRALVMDVGVRADDVPRIYRLTTVPYVTGVVLFTIAGSLNPAGFQLIWQSALPAAAGANAGLLWLRYYVPRNVVAERSAYVGRSSAWIATSAVAALVFILVLGPGVTL